MNVEAAATEPCKSIETPPLEVVSAFRDNETNAGITVNKDWPLVTVNLTPASEVDRALSSVAFRLVPESQPACLPLMETACVVLFHPSACVVLEVLPRI